MRLVFLAGFGSSLLSELPRLGPSWAVPPSSSTGQATCMHNCRISAKVPGAFDPVRDCKLCLGAILWCFIFPSVLAAVTALTCCKRKMQRTRCQSKYFWVTLEGKRVHELVMFLPVRAVCSKSGGLPWTATKQKALVCIEADPFRNRTGWSDSPSRHRPELTVLQVFPGLCPEVWNFCSNVMAGKAWDRKSAKPFEEDGACWYSTDGNTKTPKSRKRGGSPLTRLSCW